MTIKNICMYLLNTILRMLRNLILSELWWKFCTCVVLILGGVLALDLDPLPQGRPTDPKTY